MNKTFAGGVCLSVLLSLSVPACAGRLAGNSRSVALAQADSPRVVTLWPSGAPGAVGDEDADRPAVTIYLPPGKNAGSGIVVCPGGGYAGLAMNHEGTQIAAWLNSIGVAAFVLK